MPTTYYNETELKKSLQKLQERSDGITQQIADLTAEKAIVDQGITDTTKIIAYIKAGYPAITQLGTPANLAGVASAPAAAYQVALSWDAVANATAYVVERSTTADFASYEEIYNDAANSYTDTDVENDQIYYYRVKATADTYNESEYATVNVMVFEQLATPQNFNLTEGDTQIVGDFDIVPLASGYKIYMHTADDFGASSEIDDVGEGSFTKTGLSNGTTYYFWVIAYATNKIDSVAATANGTPAA